MHFESEMFDVCDDTEERYDLAKEAIQDFKVRICRYWTRGKLSEAEAAYLMGCSVRRLRDERAMQLKNMITKGKKK